MRLIILFLLITLVAIASTAPPIDSQAEHVRDIENLRDLINPESTKKGSKKPRKYKCIVIEEGDDDDMIADRLSSSTQHHHAQMDKNKFVFIEADDERRDMVVTVTDPPTSASVAPAPISTNPLRYQQQQKQPLPQQYQQQAYQQQPQQPLHLQYSEPQQQPQQTQQSSPFLQSQNEFEKVTEEEAAVEYPPPQQQQQHVQQQYQDRLVTLPTPSPSFQQQQQQPQSTHTRPQLKQIHLPKAHSFNAAAAARNNFPAAQTTLPPEIANAPRDAQNRPLILAPEHCSQIKHYANMYGVSDVRGWVHNNCSFAQSYLPTASCEEIDILVGSCYRNQLST